MNTERYSRIPRSEIRDRRSVKKDANGMERRASELAVIPDVALHPPPSTFHLPPSTYHLPPERHAWRPRVTALLAAVALACLTPLASSAVTDALPNAVTLLSEIRARLPARPVTLRGRLTTYDGDDREKSVKRIEIKFQPGAGESLDALYILSDAFGRELERLQVTRPRQAGAPVVRAFRGDPPVPAPKADWSAAIPGATVSWMA